ncbi:MAG: DNA helicase RecQ [Desulfobacterales bacterium]
MRFVATMINDAKKILKKVFGYDGFMSLQKDVIENVLRKNDTLVIMPTGGGKSLCYQIPALMFKGLTIVVSPLISLMKDQVEQLMESGISAALLNSSLTPNEYRRNVELIKQGNVKLLYVAPESLLKSGVLKMLSSVPVDCLAIDEAHCISAWGHDFRPEYRQLVDIRLRFPKAVFIALTATATPRVRKDIKSSLGFEDSGEYVAGFNRENLFLQVVPKDSPLDQTIGFIRKFPEQSGIIYCFTRRQVDDLYTVLKDEGFSVRPYHAGLTEIERKQNQNLFIRDDVQIVVATIAFGMGINKPNVRFVVHFDMPKNMESYYQEIGRAGRDGLPAHCMLLFSYADIHKITHFINKKNASEKRVARLHFNAFLRFVETDDCRRIPLLNYFGEEYSIENCNMCDNCLAGEKELTDLTIPAQKFLSCVKRTGELFGMAHVIDVLRGSTARKVLRFGHDNLSTYGIGKEFSKKQWMLLARQFLHKKLLIQDMEYGSLKLTDKAWDVFQGKKMVPGHLKKQDNVKEVEKESKIKTTPDYDKDLFNILREKRKNLADDAGVPPYVIFSDRTLIELAAYFPQSLESLLDIYGVGMVKREKYGSIFLSLIQKYCRNREIKERPKNSKIQTAILSGQGGRQNHIVIGEALDSGRSIQEIIGEFKIKQDTILNHLFKYYQEGRKIKFADELLKISTLSPAQKHLVMETIKKLGPELLKPIFQALDGKISYQELKILRLYYLIKNR